MANKDTAKYSRPSRWVFSDRRAMGWTSTLAIILFGLNLGLGLTVAQAAPAAAGFLTGFTIPFVQALVILLIKRKGAITLAMIIYGFAAIPTGLVGPQALGLWKVLVVGLSAVLYDLATYFSRRDAAIYIGFLLYTLAALGLLLWGMVLFRVPALEQLLKFLTPLVVIYIIEGFISTFLAIRFYKRRLHNRPLDRSFVQ